MTQVSVIGEVVGENFLNQVLVLGGINKDRPDRTIENSLHNCVQEVQLITLEGVSSNPLHGSISFHHLDSQIKELIVVLNNVLAAEGSSLAHSVKTVDNVIELFTERFHVEVVGNNISPVISLKYCEHLSDIVVLSEMLFRSRKGVVQVGKVSEEVTHLGHVLNELIFQCLIAEVRAFFSSVDKSV